MYVPRKSIFSKFFKMIFICSLCLQSFRVGCCWLFGFVGCSCLFVLLLFFVAWFGKLARLPSSIDESNSESYHVYVSNFGNWHETRNDKSYIFCTWTASYPSTSGATSEGFFSLVLSLVLEDLQSFSSLLFRFWRQPSCQQNLRSLLCSPWRQPSLQQNFGSLWWHSL